MLLKYFSRSFTETICKRTICVSVYKGKNHMTRVLPKHEIYGHTHILSMMSKLVRTQSVHKCVIMLGKIKELTTWNKQQCVKEKVYFYNMSNKNGIPKWMKFTSYIKIINCCVNTRHVFKPDWSSQKLHILSTFGDGYDMGWFDVDSKA